MDHRDLNSLELSVETSAVAMARAAGWWASPKLQFAGQRGAPDRMFIKAGRVVFIEFKRPSGGKKAVAQKRLAREMTQAGAEVFFCNTIGDVVLALEMGA